METVLIRAIQLILSLSILVAIHEFGHFAFAKLFKIRVEKFYLFFDPWFALFKFKPKNSDTEYGVGWLPLGGYVKISGMIDESMDKEQMAQPAQPWEFRSKPAYQRLLVMVAGVVFNFLLAIAIYAGVLLAWGESYVPLHNAFMGMDYSETAHEVGFRDGDILWSADGSDLVRFDSSILQRIAESKEVTVKRDGKLVAIPIPADFMQRFLRDKKGFANYRFPMVVNEATSAAAKEAGLKSGDRIVSVNGTATLTAERVAAALKENSGKTIDLGFDRGGELQSVRVAVDENGKLGIMLITDLSTIFEAQVDTYNLFTAIPAGIEKGIGKLSSYINSMKYVFTKEGAASIGGFGTIASLFPSGWDWEVFWGTTAFLSIMLAFMNILPIPALDGGHVLFLLVEVITRRKPSDKFLEYAQMGGMFLLLALLIYANGNDLFRFLFK